MNNRISNYVRPTDKTTASGEELKITGKATVHRKMTGEEFTAALALACLSDEDVAFLVGTRPERVANWKDGRDAVPFYLVWALDLLESPDNLDRAIALAEQRAAYKPAFMQRGRIMHEIANTVAKIEKHKADALMIAEHWEEQNPGQVHDISRALMKFETLQNAAGEMNPARRLNQLTEILGKVGGAEDLNEAIERENAGLAAERTRQRRDRLAKQRAAAPELPAYRRR